MQQAKRRAGLRKESAPDTAPATSTAATPRAAPCEREAGAPPAVATSDATSGIPVIGIGGSAGALEALNLLNSTRIATLFLDGELRVKFFTPAMAQVLSLIPSDTGRPISDLSVNFVDYDLTADARSVAQGGPVRERDAWHADGSCYRVRVMPYLVQDDRADGVVVTFDDVTVRKQAEKAMRASAQRERAEELAVLFESVPMPVFIARDPDCLHLTGNRLADEILRIPHGHELSMTGPAETKPQHFKVFKDGHELRLDELPAQRSARGEHVKDFEFSIVFDDGMVRHVMGYGNPLLDEQGRPRGTVAVLVDITDRKRMEETQHKQAVDMLRLSEQEFYFLAEAMPQIVWATRPDGWNIYFNQQWVDYTGMTMEESYGHGWNKPFHPDDQKRAWDAWQRATKHNEPYSLECRLRRADGVYRWWLVRGAPMRGAGGEILKWFGTCTDIEEIKRAEAALRESNELLEQRVAERTTALRESEERFRFALQNAPVSVAMQDRNLVYQWAYNQRTHRPDEIVGKTDADLFAPEDVPAILETKRRVIESGTPVHVAHWLTSNGQRIFLDLHYEPLRNPAGEITGIGIAAVNLTAQKRTEEALLQSRNQFRVLTQNIDAGVALVDEHGQFAIVNPVFLRLFDLPDGSSIKNVNDCDWVKWQVFEENGELVHVDEHPVRKAVLTNRAVRDRLVGVKTPSGASLKWMLISAEPILRADGHMEALICTYLDITDRKRAEESLRDALREKEVLLKEVHHRVKNNMQVLASLVSLQADAVGDPATRALFDDFRDQVRTMAQVHESLYQSENLTSIAFDEFANGLTTNLARTHSRGDAAIRLTLDVEPVTLPIESAVPCGLILNELVTNAYKHAFRGRDAGEIVVSLRADAAGRVCLGVYDNGVGLPAGLDWQQSTTLGLRLVQILARQVRGEFDICVEHGTVFQLAFTPPTPKAP